MCGLAGEIRFDQRPASVDRVSRMARTQSRRGPDGSGIFGYGKVALGHSRLKIIDLTDRGRQLSYLTGVFITIRKYAEN